jgi:predicted RNase H-like HicB family nuclease
MEAADEALDESSPTGASSLERMEAARDVEFVFEPEPEGGYHAYAPELPGLHPQGEDLEEASANAEEALALYVEGMREEGRSLVMGVIRRRVTLPA